MNGCGPERDGASFFRAVCVGNGCSIVGKVIWSWNVVVMRAVGWRANKRIYVRWWGVVGGKRRGV
jgi:hypothetical protein